MRFIFKLCLVWAALIAWDASAQTTDVGRLQVTHPDRGFSGAGTTLHDTVRAGWTEFSDHISSRYFEKTGVLDSVTTTLTHNFGLGVGDLQIAFYTGTAGSKVRVLDPTTAGWTIAQNTVNAIDVTAPVSGGPHSFSVEIFSALAYSQVAAGSSSLPSYSFQVDPDTGMYRNSNNKLGFSSGGVEKFTIGTNVTTLSDQHLFGDGAVGTPSIAFSSTPSTGIYKTGAASIGIAAAGAGFIVGTSANLSQRELWLQDGSAASPSLAFENAVGTGLWTDATDDLNFSRAGEIKGDFTDTSFSVYNDTSDMTFRVYATAGIAKVRLRSDTNVQSALEFGHDGDADDGAITYTPSLSRFTFTNNSGVERLRIDDSIFAYYDNSGQATALVQSSNSNSVLRLLALSSADSIIQFGDAGDGDIGRILYDHAGNDFYIYTSGVNRWQITESGHLLGQSSTNFIRAESYGDITGTASLKFASASSTQNCTTQCAARGDCACVVGVHLNTDNTKLCGSTGVTQRCMCLCDSN